MKKRFEIEEIKSANAENSKYRKKNQGYDEKKWAEECDDDEMKSMQTTKRDRNNDLNFSDQFVVCDVSVKFFLLRSCFIIQFDRSFHSIKDINFACLIVLIFTLVQGIIDYYTFANKCTAVKSIYHVCSDGS